MIICNCHNQTFSIDHVPKNFVPRPVGELVKRKVFRNAIRRILHFTDRDFLDRYINFFEVALLGTPEAIRKTF